MTTIAYKNGVIAYDSLITCSGVVSYKDFDKSRTVDGITFFISGSICDYEVLINNWFSSRHKDIAASAFVFDGESLFECGHKDGKMWKEKLDHKNCVSAIGSGWQFALMAMDLGLSAEDAVKKASERCIYTGGKIRTFTLP